jgi:hypothetical protein
LEKRQHSEGFQMEPDRKHLYLYDVHTLPPPVPGAASTAIAGIILFSLFLGAACVALDNLPFQILGYVLYPLEYALNFAFFPHAATPLRGNGSALIVLTLTLFLFGGGYFAARAAVRRTIWFFRWIRG